MRYAMMLALVVFPLAAQDPVIARGRLLESDTGQTGEFSIRAQNDRVYWYVYDLKTYVEQDEKLSSVPKLHKNDEIEVVSDIGPDAALRYARTIHVVESPKEALVKPQFSLGRYAMPRHPAAKEDPPSLSSLDFLVPRGNLTFAGLICQVNDERFVLRTRTGGEKTIYLRTDTRLMNDGTVVPASSLRLNARVFVRGGKNLDGEIEAYQVIWGGILEPNPEH